MLKRDPIFWAASAIFVLALVLFAVMRNQMWLTLMIGSYLLRPTLASLGLAKRYVDERQLSIHYRSGNIGFAVTIIVCIIFAIKLSSEDNHDFELFAMTIMIGLAAKALFNVILAKNYREAASKIIIGVGLLVGLFASFDAGSVAAFLASVGVGVAIAALGLVSRKYPKPVGAVLFALAALAMVIILRRITWGQIGVAVLIGVPLVVAGVCLFVGDKTDKETK